MNRAEPAPEVDVVAHDDVAYTNNPIYVAMMNQYIDHRRLPDKNKSICQ